MALSAITYTCDGVVKDYPLNLTLGYLDKSHIHVYLDKVEQTSGWSFTMGDSVVTFDNPPAKETALLIRRITPNDKLIHDYSDGSQIIEDNLDQSNLQALMLFHEALDGFPSGDETEAFNRVNADKRYINKSGDTMEGPLSVESPTLPEHAAQQAQITEVLSTLDRVVQEEALARSNADSNLKSALDNAVQEESSARIRADANLQSQITGEQPLEGSAFSPISWHKQVVENSVTIPDNVNAWSFGPKITVDSGQVVEIGTNSFWTIHTENSNE